MSKRKNGCGINYGSCDKNSQSKISRFGCKIEGGLWKENVIIENALKIKDGTTYHKPLKSRVFIHRLFQNVDQQLKENYSVILFTVFAWFHITDYKNF